MRERLQDLSSDAEGMAKDARNKGFVMEGFVWQLLADVCDFIVLMGWC